MLQFLPDGIYLADLDLWLDPRAPKRAAWVSHAHSDHAAGLHGTVLATAETLALYRVRWPEQPEVAQELVALAFGHPQPFRGARLTAYPAGHIRGSAQLLIERGGERILYTGDVKLRAPLDGPRAHIPECDTLIIESTFGLPIYRFLEREQAADRIVRFAHGALSRGETPVLAGYALGRGQEIAQVLAAAGIPAMLHGAIAKFVPLYENFGARFDGWRPYERGRTEGCAVVWLTGATRQLEVRSPRVAAVSGWAALHNARARYGAEELIPYSDHADFGELEEIVRSSRARQVYTVHGYAGPLARLLEQRLGVQAVAAQALESRPEMGEAS